MGHPEAITFITPVTDLRGVGSERAAQLERLGIRTVGDLLLHKPRRYEDRRNVRPIGSLAEGEVATVHGRIVALGTKKFARGRKSVFEIVLEDGTGRLHCRWWNQPFMKNYFKQGEEVLAHGKVRLLRPPSMDSPDTEIVDGGEETFIHLNRIVPIYPLTEGLTQRWLRGLAWKVLQLMQSQLAAVETETSISGMLDRGVAIQKLHFPERVDEAEAARRRLALDEFLILQRQMEERRRALLAHAPKRQCAGDNSLIRPFLGVLPFGLTEAQTRVLKELRQDLREGSPMRRLLQGDVGSGKTVVAACCALMVIESGYEVALMAPTEILAEQHFAAFVRWFEPLGIAVRLQTGSKKTDDENPLPLLQSRFPTLTVGTHALIEGGLEFKNLGLVIIDEQHKFGVSQRERLIRKGHYPHLLVMTATPIPRTLGLTIYGDLDISTIDQMPKGRRPVKTYVRTTDQLEKVWEFVRTKLDQGQQAYVVYPRVDESEDKGLKAVTREWSKIEKIFAPYKTGLLHGRMKSAEKEAVMGLFRSNQIQVLVATQVIEVGVDVPNATIMVIENAEQFGLAQLHQLRGRIGRGREESFCILIASAKTLEAKRRLETMEKTSDGFQIAEEDLKLRGPGDMLGWQQSGVPPLRFGDLIGDRALVEQARRIVKGH